MKRFQRILAHVPAGRPHEEVLRRGEELGRRNGARLTLIDVVESTPTLLERLFRRVPDVVAKNPDRAERLASIGASSELGPETVLAAGTPYEEIVRRVLRSDHDLVLKAAGQTEDRFLGPTDVQLLRKCPCPLWLLDSRTGPAHRVMACVHLDPEEDEPLPLDRTVLELAGSLARREGAELVVAHAWEAGEELLPVEVDAEAHREYVRTQKARVQEQLAKLLADVGEPVAGARVELLQGVPGTELPALAQQLEVDVLVLGTVSRSGVRGLLLGSTAEDVLKRTRGSILAVKPPGFRTPVRPRGRWTSDS